MESKEQLYSLLEKYRHNECTVEELALLKSWYDKIQSDSPSYMSDLGRTDRIWAKIVESPRFNSNKPTPVIKLKRIIFIAAALLAGVLLTVTIYIRKTDFDKELASPGNFSLVEPGGEKATLKLSNGHEYNLTNAQKGFVIEAEGFQIAKNREGLVLISNNDVQSGTEKLNVLTTPRGGQYQIILPDGTKVWLNAESELSFPNQFDPRRRIVSIKGEAYFEVAKRERAGFNEGAGNRIPFIVETARQQIEVLGTHFNIQAYPDEKSQQTTLLEGAVQVKDHSTGKIIRLSPGQKASSGADFSLEKADISAITAWTKGDFIFHQERLSSILQKVARWYDIEVSCPDYLGDMPFEGMVSRKQSLAAIVKMIESTNEVKLTLKGRRLLVER
mgnify:CR=1 FL=1